MARGKKEMNTDRKNNHKGKPSEYNDQLGENAGEGRIIKAQGKERKH